MNRPYYYSSSEQQFQPTQWTSQPSFYNGYAGRQPIILNQPITVVQNYYTPIEQYHHQQPYQQIPSTYQPASPMKFRNPFSSSSHQQKISDSDQEFYYHEEQLNRNLAKHGIERLPVKGDGNCLFYALAEGLIYEMKVDRDQFAFHIRRFLNLPTHFGLVDFADRLRQLCVEEWKLHENYYSQFIDKEKATFLKEVKKFSKNGVSDSILGDIVPLTIANTLNVNITIFTSVTDLPRIDVKPEHKNNLLSLTRKTIYLAYNQYGLGHYDAAYPRT